MWAIRKKLRDNRMGYMWVDARIWNIEEPSREKRLKLLADTGAIYTVIPSKILEELGVEVIGRRRFRLANNQVIVRDIGLIGIEVKGIKTYTQAVFGDDNVYLLGVVTLEELGFEIDSVTGDLKPMELLLMKYEYGG